MHAEGLIAALMSSTSSGPLPALLHKTLLAVPVTRRWLDQVEAAVVCHGSAARALTDHDIATVVADAAVLVPSSLGVRLATWFCSALLADLRAVFIFQLAALLVFFDLGV